MAADGFAYVGQQGGAAAKQFFHQVAQGHGALGTEAADSQLAVLLGRDAWWNAQAQRDQALTEVFRVVKSLNH